MNSAVENDISLYWLSPHADYATADKVTLTITDPLAVVREVDLVPTVDPKSSSEYAIYNLNLSLAGTTYPLTVNRVRIYKGATLLRDCLDVTLAGKTLAHSGTHNLGINLTILISEHKWENVSGYGESKTITITTTGGADWTASASGTGLSVSPTSGKSGQTATITWGLNIGYPAPATRTGKVVFATNPNGAAETLSCTQAGAVDRIKLNGLWWALSNVSNAATWYTAMTLCQSPWRLPSRTDFEKLISSGRINETGLQSGYYWSSTEYPSNTSRAYFLSNGGLGSNGKNSYCNVRCCQ